MKKLALLFLQLLLIGSFTSAYSSQEQNEAYKWAYSKGITTQPFEKANLNGYITREQLAKMLVKFYESIRGEIVYVSDPSACAFADKAKITEGLKPFVHAACELGYMGVGIKNFNPTGSVTRAQFGTTLSRVIFGEHFDGGTPYYQKHLDALKKRGIMSNITSPNTNEKRGDVMVMLKKAYDDIEKELDDIASGKSSSKDEYKVIINKIY